MNNPDKASLAHYIAGEVGAEDASVNGSFPKGDIIQFIINACAQLHRLKWKKSMDVLKNLPRIHQNVYIIVSKGLTHVSFDGYISSIKDATRTKRAKPCLDIHFDLSMPCEVSRNIFFFSNSFNKNRLIKKLMDFLPLQATGNELQGLPPARGWTSDIHPPKTYHKSNEITHPGIADIFINISIRLCTA